MVLPNYFGIKGIFILSGFFWPGINTSDIVAMAKYLKVLGISTLVFCQPWIQFNHSRRWNSSSSYRSSPAKMHYNEKWLKVYLMSWLKHSVEQW